MNRVRYYYNGAELPGDWKKLSNCRNYAESVRAIREKLRPKKTGKHYCFIRFADSGNIFVAGNFNQYEELKQVLTRTGRNLEISFSGKIWKPICSKMEG